MINMVGQGESLNILDIIIMIIFLYFLLSGYKSGLIKQVSKIFGLITAILVAINQFEPFSEYLEPYLELPPQVLMVLSFIIIFIIINIAVHIVGVFLSKLVKFLYLSPLDYLAGSLFGILKGGIFAYFLVFVLNEIPYEIISEQISSSYFSTHLLELTPFIQENLLEIFNPD